MNAIVTAELHGEGFAAALKSGIYRVINDQDKLNAINVFPVPDGDTGTNLSLSLGSALATLRDSRDSHLGKLLARIADDLPGPSPSAASMRTMRCPIRVRGRFCP